MLSCSACVKQNIDCAWRGGVDGAKDSATYDTTPMSASHQYQQMPIQPYAGQQQVLPEVFSPGEYRHRDLSDLLGVLKIGETGTGENGLS